MQQGKPWKTCLLLFLINTLTFLQKGPKTAEANLSVNLSLSLYSWCSQPTVSRRYIVRVLDEMGKEKVSPN